MLKLKELFVKKEFAYVENRISIKFHFMLQECFAKFTVNHYRWPQYFTAPRVNYEIVQSWSSWTNWTWGSDFLHQERSRVCCAENCTGTNFQRRSVNFGKKSLNSKIFFHW